MISRGFCLRGRHLLADASKALIMELKLVTDAMLECDAGPTNVTMCLTVGEFQIGQKSQVHIEHVSAKTTFKKYGSKAMIFCRL